MDLFALHAFFIALCCFDCLVHTYDLKEVVVESDKPVKIFSSDEIKEYDDSVSTKNLVWAILGSWTAP